MSASADQKLNRRCTQINTNAFPSSRRCLAATLSRAASGNLPGRRNEFQTWCGAYLGVCAGVRTRQVQGEALARERVAARPRRHQRSSAWICGCCSILAVLAIPKCKWISDALNQASLWETDCFLTIREVISRATEDERKPASRLGPRPRTNMNGQAAVVP